jgi:hypothetical protein
MDYIVINLSPIPRIITVDGDPIIFSTKQDAFKAADKLTKGLVYPIVNVMKVFEQIKELTKKYIAESTDDCDLLDELLAITDEII